MQSAADRLDDYLRALLEENERINLTGIRSLEQARVLHSLDSLAIENLSLAPARCLDLGSGNGFPGVALRLLYPAAEVTLLDRTRKKLLAIERVLAATGITGVETVHVDAEQAPRTLPELCGRFDLVVVRALGTPEKVARLAEPLTAFGGHLVLWLDAGTPAPATLEGFSSRRVHDYELPEPAARHRRLACYRRD